MIRRLLGLLPLLIASHALAQQLPAAGDDPVDLRPPEFRFDNLTVEDLPIPMAPELPAPGEGGEDAASVSDDVLGPRKQVDEAFGAFQRGYFLTALDMALPRAEKGDAAAQTLIATIYADGLGVRQNFASASSWYALASNNGDVLATFELAMLYQEGLGVPQNRQRSAELFEQAAAKGNISAKYNLALLYVEGRYVKPDVVKAATLMKEAADAGLPEAQYDYGMMLIEGAGLAPDPAAGAAQLLLAATAGLPSAEVDYATMLYLGQGVPKDLEGAIRWYRKAADTGSPVAQNRLAKLLAVGEGVPLDLEEAAMWRALARRQGLTDPLLDKLLVSIQPDELARAEERARFWPSEPPTPTGPQIKIVDTRNDPNSTEAQGDP